MDFLSAQEKADVEGLFGSLHDTFSRPIYYYKKPQEVVISTSTNHNSFFQDAANNTEVQLIVQSGAMNARILYGQKQVVNDLHLMRNQNNSSQNLFLEEGEARIKVSSSDAVLFNDVDRIVIDGDPYRKNTSPRKIGPFSLAWTSIYLKRDN